MNEDELRGQLIARLREDRLWTREELAKRAKVTPTTVTQAETGRTHVRLRTIGKLADALGVPAATLLRPAEEKELATAGKAEAPREAGPTTTEEATESPEESEEERLLTRMIHRLIADMEADAIRWESAAHAGEVSLAVYKEIVARRISIQSSLGDLDDVSETLGVNISDRRGSPLRRVRRDLQSAFNRWNAARMELIDLHFDARMKAEEGEPEEEGMRDVAYIAEWRAEKNAAEQIQTPLIDNVG